MQRKLHSKKWYYSKNIYSEINWWKKNDKRKFDEKKRPKIFLTKISLKTVLDGILTWFWSKKTR